VKNLHVAVREWGDEIVFLHRISPGRTNRSYGIHVAKLAGLPSPVVARADELIERLSVEEGALGRAVDDGPEAGAGPRERVQMSLFTEYVPHPAIDELRSMDLEKLSPMEAFDALRKLRERLDGGDDPD